MAHANWLQHERALFWIAFLAGMAACTVDGIGRTETYGWLHPISISGS